MANDTKNNEIENNKFLDEIKGKLNASSSNFLDTQYINEITNELWIKTNHNADRCLIIINKLSNRIKKTEDFKLKSKDFLQKLSKNLNASGCFSHKNSIAERRNILSKIFYSILVINLTFIMMVFPNINLIEVILANIFTFFINN